MIGCDSITDRSCRASPARPGRPVRPAPLSPSTSRKANARSGFGPSLRAQRAERLADFAAVVRAMHGDQRVERMIAERGRKRELLLRRRDRVRRCWARRNSRPDAWPACRSRRARSSSLASTICTSVDQPSDVHAEKARAERRARLAFAALPDRRRQNTKVPDTAHSPGSAACSNTNVSDGSSRMVRRQFHRGPRVAGSSQSDVASAATSGAPLDVGLADAAHQQVAVVVDVAAHARLRREPRQIVLAIS